MSQKTATTYQFYFGKQIQVLNRAVSKLDFSRFLKEHIVPEFENFAVVEGTGYWKGEPEDVFIVTIITENFYDAIVLNGIAEAYKKQFYQDMVLVNTFTCFPNLI